jgi:nicotinate-nucleotide adenylyltransferase
MSATQNTAQTPQMAHAAHNSVRGRLGPHIPSSVGGALAEDGRRQTLWLTESERGHHHARPRIGIMGGTFDPIHMGHLVAASEVEWKFDLDEVIFVPTGRPVFKLHQHVTDAEDRYLMTVIATSSNPRFTVSRVDIDRPGVTYTIDTLRDMHRLYPNCDLFFITGADAIAEIFEWKDADQMWDLAHFVAVTRPGYPSDLSKLKLPRGAVDMLEIPALAISSTDVRRRASHGEPVRYLVPEGVVEYINKHGLYRSHVSTDTEHVSS